MVDMDMKQLVQMSVLSKQWRYFWKSFPYLNFDGRLWIEDKEETRGYHYLAKNMKIDEFIKFVTKVLNLRDGSTIKRIKTLKLIDTRIIHDEPELYDRNDELGHLKKLELTCPTLENLVIEDKRLYERIIIHAPCLKFLRIKSGTVLLICWDECVIKICAPNLRELQLRGGYFANYVLDNLCSLDNAQVDTAIRRHEKTEEENEEEYAITDSGLCNLLKGLVSTKSLTLSADAFQGETSAEIPYMFADVPQFYNLKYFKLTNWRTNSCVPALAKMFVRFPSMEALVLEKTTESHPSSLAKEEEEWGEMYLTWGMFWNLKSVEIKGIECTDNELKFLEFVLKKALVLESITVTPISTLSIAKLREFNRKIQRLSRAYSSVTIILN
ncbi:hypothetical protein FRX31_023388 [Thalictrum thalictroides]|uniref:FBD domain-containing protein n=1 Tax=Thalictrum thalictroides TaxID=46969 RepID=A0A7J6VPJ5_THATH|nr:hypothetical protein FRX31_023388 [Thalictrum thalictroides]